MAAVIGNWRSGNIRGEEVASLPLVREERHRIVEEERKVVAGVRIEEIWRDYITAKRLLEIAEAVGDEKRAETQRGRRSPLRRELIWCSDSALMLMFSVTENRSLKDAHTRGISA